MIAQWQSFGGTPGTGLRDDKTTGLLDEGDGTTGRRSYARATLLLRSCFARERRSSVERAGDQRVKNERALAGNTLTWQLLSHQGNEEDEESTLLRLPGSIQP